MRVVIDTNVIVSGLIFTGNERRVLDLARRRRFDIYLSQFIVDETRSVLARKFQLDPSDINTALAILTEIAQVIEPTDTANVVPDQHADNRILGCAAAATADYLVTGDRRRLFPIRRYETTNIVNAAAFLAILDQAHPSPTV